ncbi:methyltransferase family protein [Streptomyces olivaceoviridis]
MYGLPLTIYLLGSWLGSRFPLLRNTHAGGHLSNDLTGWRDDPWRPFHLASYVATGAGFWLIAAAWRVLHSAVQHDTLAATGPYAHVRHPQYDGLFLIMIGFLLQWPTITP